MSEFPSLPI